MITISSYIQLSPPNNFSPFFHFTNLHPHLIKIQSWLSHLLIGYSILIYSLSFFLVIPVTSRLPIYFLYTNAAWDLLKYVHNKIKSRWVISLDGSLLIFIWLTWCIKIILFTIILPYYACSIDYYYRFF